MTHRLAPFFFLTLLASALAQTTPAPQTAPAPQDATSKPVEKNDYSKPENWLCQPGRADSCASDLTATVITVDGKTSTETWSPNPSAPVDCFYVYPTVSTQSSDNSDMTQEREERTVTRNQFARFASICKPYAPMYRQLTLPGLVAAMNGRSISQARLVAYKDVADAWHYYLDHFNQGRGVILIGHSQGANILARLIKAEIDGRPIQSQIISASLIGATVAVPKGKDVGGTFQKMPLCRAASQTACVIVYESFPANDPPQPGGLFGSAHEEGMQQACTNPAALNGGSGELHSYLVNSDRSWINLTPPGPWLKSEGLKSPALKDQTQITTPFVSLPGLISSECDSNEQVTYLAITVHPSPTDQRTGDIGGTIKINGNVLHEWGLHSLDVDLAEGNLVEIFKQQSKAWLAQKH
jgi:hypothetical protein